jgi:uncharacterized protein (DUF58 family)
MLAVSVALVLGGLFLGDRGACLVGLILLAFTLIGSAHSPIRLETTRRISHPTTHVGTQVNVDLSIEARADSDRIIEVQDELSHRLWLDGGVVNTSVYLGEGDRIEVGYRLYCPLRGHLRVGPLKVRSRDFFGLSWTDLTFDVRDIITVFPALDISTWRPRHIPSHMPEVGQRSRGLVGLGTEFFSIRDYNRGDPYRFINWKATARLRRYMVNEFELEASSDVMLFVDLREGSLTGTPTLNAAERGVELAACLVEQFVHQRRDVGLVLYGRRPFVLPPGTGQRQLSDALYALTGVASGGETSFKEALELAMHYMTSRTRIVVISPLFPDETLPTALTELGLRGRKIIVVRVEPFDFQAGIRTYRLPESYDVTSRQVGVYKDLLRDAGVLTLDWGVGSRPRELLEVMRVASP